MKNQNVTVIMGGQVLSQDEGIRFLTTMAKQNNMAPIYYVEYQNGTPVVVDSWARPAVPEDFGPDGMLIMDRVIEYV